MAHLVLAAGTLCATQMAIADHHVKRGTYEFVFSGVTALTTVEYPDSSITAGSVEGTMTTIASNGGPFAAGETGIYSGVLYPKKSLAGMDLERPDVTTDSSRDKWFMTARRNVGGQEVGGTGKYEGLTGTREYHVNYLADNRIINQVSCQWARN